MKFTGERFIPTEQGRIRLEHYHRYAMVLDVVTEKDVLDVACGEGYGSAFMADVARSVVGVDISDEAVRHASTTYAKANLTFRQGSATALDFADASFDIVVSFETIEHLAEQAQMLAELRRVLRPDGVLVISSPNRPIYSEESGEHNEFHVKELDFNEFDALLKTQFPTIQYFGQRILMGSVIQSLEGGQSSFHAWHDDGNDLKRNAGQLAEPVYFVAVCGASHIGLPSIDMSVLYPDKLDLVKHYVGFAKWAQMQDQIVTEREGQIANLNQAVAATDGQIAGLNQVVAERDGQIASLNQAVAATDGQIAGLNQTVGRLNQVVAERDGQIARQSLNINSMDIEMQKFVKPAYLLKALISQMNRRFRMAYPFMIERLVPGKRSRRILAQQVELINNSNAFMPEWYLEQNPDVAAADIDPLVHYLHHGAVEGRNPNPLFDSRWYLEQNPDVAVAGINPLAHYLNNGGAEGRKPSPLFDSHWYLEQNPDVVAAGINPLVHFILFGAEEGRQPKPRPFRDMKVLCENLLRKNRKPVEKIRFESFDAPKVSVIIPIYNQVHYTLQCLESIRRYLPAVAFEVIVVDDCSLDDSAKKLSAIDGLKIVTNETNQGFIRSCNIGAKAARGEYLHFLNNDTEVTAGWLDELVGTFHEFPGTGFVGSKLVYPDGSLQEAGGVIWQDGSAWNFGRNQDPQLPVYNYAREVDYCSGASVMVPRALFEELGGFDEHYLPAYCEDSDLALKIRDKGYRVIYQPMSTVVHYEGITSGTDVTQGTKAYQIENTRKLYERWKNRLQTHQPAGVDADNAKDRRATRRVLVIELGTPMPNQDAGSVTVFNLMMLLREMDFQVTFIPEENLLYMPEYTTALQRAGIEMLYAPYINNVEQHLRGVGDRYDLVFLFRPMVAERQLKNIRKHCPKAKVIYHTVDLHFLRMMREAELQSDNAKQIAALDMKQREFAAIRGSDASIVHSTAEFELLRPELPVANLHVYPLILDVHGTTQTFFERKDIVFVGGYGHPPNVDAVQYFVTEIMPLFRPRLPGVRFHVVGSNPTVEIKALASEDVIIVGFVEDLHSLLGKMRVSVAPLRYGAGIKGKVGTAMAVGLPVVAAPTAAEGMSLTDGENILVANGAKQFADAVVRLYQDEVLWNRISHNSIEFAENAWGAEAAWKILAGILDELSLNTVRGAYPLSLFAGAGSAQNKVDQLHELTPIAAVRNREEFNQLVECDSLKQIRAIEKKLIDSSKDDAFTVDGYCVPCNKKVSFLVDMQSGGQRQANSWLPNWRERLECPLCRMNNRQRLIATLVKQELDVQHKKHVYFMEQVTPIYNWAAATFVNHNIVGSEYLGYEYEGGAIIKGIRHEDVENLSFPKSSLDLIVSNDVFEHVPNPARAFAECARVLKAGGVMLATIPFHSSNDLSVIRAKIVDGQLEHILPPSYHGNPVSADGSLVFTDFGWGVLKEMQAAGFSDVSVEVYASVDLGHLGGGQLIFRARK